MNMNATAQMVTTTQVGCGKAKSEPGSGEDDIHSVVACVPHAFDNAALAAVTQERDNATGNCMSLSQLLFIDRLLLEQIRELTDHNKTGCGTCHTIRNLMEDYGRRRLAERERG